MLSWSVIGISGIANLSHPEAVEDAPAEAARRCALPTARRLTASEECRDWISRAVSSRQY